MIAAAAGLMPHNNLVVACYSSAQDACFLHNPASGAQHNSPSPWQTMHVPKWPRLPLVGPRAHPVPEHTVQRASYTCRGVCKTTTEQVRKQLSAQEPGARAAMRDAVVDTQNVQSVTQLGAALLLYCEGCPLVLHMTLATAAVLRVPGQAICRLTLQLFSSGSHLSSSKGRVCNTNRVGLRPLPSWRAQQQKQDQQLPRNPYRR
jgi:hypothetical protein